MVAVSPPFLMFNQMHFILESDSVLKVSFPTSHPWTDLLQSVLKVSNAGINVTWIEGEEEFSIISIDVMV